MCTLPLKRYMMMDAACSIKKSTHVEVWWHTVMHGRGSEGVTWVEWVARTLHTTSEHGVCSITTTDAHTSAPSSQLNWCLRQFKLTRPFRWEKKYGFCACVITFQMQSTKLYGVTTMEANRFVHWCENLKFWLWNCSCRITQMMIQETWQ
jgi:hypothetical protein